MNPNQITSSTGEQLDPSVVTLAKAIRSVESDNNYYAHGQSGEFGAYQFMPESWKGSAQRYLGDPNAPMTPINQDKVAYYAIKGYKDQGYSPEEVASLWNSGKPDWRGNIGTNAQGVKYDTPAYVNNVINAYTQLRAQPQIQSTDNQPPSVQGFLENTVSSASNVLGSLGNAVLHPIKTAEALGSTAAGAVESIPNALGITHIDNADTEHWANLLNTYGQRYGGSSPGEIVKNIGHTLYTDPVGAALDLSVILDAGASTLGKVGAITDAAKAADIAKASDFISTAQGLVKSGSPEAIKALTEPGTLSKLSDALETASKYTNPVTPLVGATAGMFNKISDITDSLPRRIVNNLLPALKNPDTLDYAVKTLKFTETPEEMLTTSQNALRSYNSQIESILQHPDYIDKAISGTDLIDNVLKQFPNSEYTPDTIFAKLKSQIPANAGLVTKLENGSLTLEEANKLRQALDKITYKTVIDSPEVRAGKDLAQATGNTLRDQVKSLAPETRDVFNNYAKEINLQKALRKMALKEGKKGAISMKDMIGALGGAAVGGPIGSLGILGLEKTLERPGTKIAGAKILKSVSKGAEKIGGAVSKAGPIVKASAVASRIAQSTNQ